MWALLILSTALVAGCGQHGMLSRFMLHPERIIVERRPDPVYDQLFPYYVELCATSQFRSSEKGRGGVTGHAIMYVKGACKDEGAPYPQLRRCRVVATDLHDPEHGAGVSVGRWFRNVNWIAIPGYDLFYRGNLPPGERLTQARFDAALQAAIDRGVYHGVELHEYPTTNLRTLDDFVRHHSLGTDFALQFARSLFCARLPLTEPMLDEIMAFLNDKNREYATGKADYNWSLLADNCVHTVRNALAAANIWSPLSVQNVKLRHLFNLAVPANEFVNLAELGTESDITDYRRIQRDDARRDALHEYHWLPARHGAPAEDAGRARAERPVRHGLPPVHPPVPAPDGQDAARGRAPLGRALRRPRDQPPPLPGQVRGDPRAVPGPRRRPRERARHALSPRGPPALRVRRGPARRRRQHAGAARGLATGPGLRHWGGNAGRWAGI
jgi:hypothetical protein